MSNERRPSLAPKDNVDAWKMAQALADARGMIPDSFAGRPSEVFAAILRGNELGFGPMQALSAIAVINGRPAIWGDAVPALVQRHGHTLDHVMAGEGDNRKAVATLKRGDTGHEYVREFSVRDAKAAGLWGRKGPWTQYPDRMLAMRARSFAARDGAADAMAGISVAEEVRDIEEIKPRKSRPTLEEAAGVEPERIIEHDPVETLEASELTPAEIAAIEAKEAAEASEMEGWNA